MKELFVTDYRAEKITVAYGTNDRCGDQETYQERVGKYPEWLVSLWLKEPVFVIMPLCRMGISGTEDFAWIYPVMEKES